MVKDITFTDEILEEVAEEFGLTIKEVEDIYDQMIQYIKYKINFTDVCSIRFPFLGVMYINALTATKKIKKLKERKPTDSNLARLAAWIKKRTAIKESSDKYRKVAKVPNRRKSIFRKINRSYYNKKEENIDWEKIEDLQNKDI